MGKIQIILIQLARIKTLIDKEIKLINSLILDYKQLLIFNKLELLIIQVKIKICTQIKLTI